MSRTKFTVLLPTTGNRGALLPYSIGSIQNQTIRDFEIFIIGDGLSEETRKMIQEMMNQDSRIKLFDHPKHERRGEPYRHKALQEADSDFVCYLCDRDMMLPDHLETMEELLEEYNFASTTYIDVKEDQTIIVNQYIKYYGKGSENDDVAVQWGAISLSNVGHTLELYHQLPYGWRTTPENQFTDTHMWRQFLVHPKCNAYSYHRPTIMYFKRGGHPGASVEIRKKDLELWADRIREPKDIKRLKNEAYGNLILEKNRLKSYMYKMFSSSISIRGHTIKEATEKFFRKAFKLMKG